MSSGTKNAIQNTLPLIAWEPEYNLGIHIVDEHHKGILTVINSLNHEIQRQQGEGMIVPIFKVMQEYTHIHFKIEEEFLEKFGFPDLVTHRALHSELMDKLSKVGEESVSKHAPHQFMDFLKEWWIDHICNKDQAFRYYLLGE